MTPRPQAGVVHPPRELAALLDLGRFLEQHTEPGLLLGPDGEQVPLPEEVYQVLVDAVEAMREGKVITVVPRTQRLTTQEAADFLGRAGSGTATSARTRGCRPRRRSRPRDIVFILNFCLF
jgi:hypothetical protein